MPQKGQVSITLPKELYSRVAQIVENSQGNIYSSVTHFIRVAIETQFKVEEEETELRQLIQEVKGSSKLSPAQKEIIREKYKASQEKVKKSWIEDLKEASKKSD